MESLIDQLSAETNNTFTEQLSVALESVLTGIDIAEFRNLRKELEAQINFTPIITAIQAATNALSSVPVNPYEILLSEYFEPDHKFKTIDDIPDPGSLPLMECLNFLKEKDNNVNKIMFHNLTACDEQKFTSVFCYLSNDQVMVDRKREKNYLEFYEMVRNISFDSINEETCNTISNKIIAEYIKVV